MILKIFTVFPDIFFFHNPLLKPYPKSREQFRSDFLRPCACRWTNICTRRSRPSVASEEKSRRWTHGEPLLIRQLDRAMIFDVCDWTNSHRGFPWSVCWWFVTTLDFWPFCDSAESRAMRFGRQRVSKETSERPLRWRRTSWRAWLDEARVGKQFFSLPQNPQFSMHSIFPRSNSWI